MKLDDCDKIPCSADEWHKTSGPSMRLDGVNCEVYYFKLVPKWPGKCEDCGTARTGKEHKWCGACYRKRMDKIIEDERFTAIDEWIDSCNYNDCSIENVRKLRKEFVRKVVKLIEEKK